MASLTSYMIFTIALVIVAGGSISYPLMMSGPHKPVYSDQETYAIGAPKVGDIFPYDCSVPANDSQLTCAALPSGYVILPRSAAAPQPSRPGGMTDAAWALLQKTYGNGVCDPNETWYTSPLDCSATGTMVNDPWTGRPNAPASVCALH